MACGPSDAIAPCERFSRLSKWFARPGPGSKEMSASSSRPHQWPASTFRPARLALTLLRVASGKLGEAKTGIEAQNDGAAVVGLPGRSLGLDIEYRRGAANARPPAA